MQVLNVGNRIVNSFVYKSKNGYVMIDTGYPKDLLKVVNKLKKYNLSLKDIKYIFLTHAHDDHAGFLKELINNEPHIKIIASKKSQAVLKNGQNSFVGGCSGLSALMFCNLMKLFGKGKHLFPALTETEFVNFIWVDENNKTEIEKILDGQIYFTPGHTSDSISFLTVDKKLFCGDSTMNGFPSHHKITIWIENKENFIQSWQDIIDMKPTQIYPGHGKPFCYNSLKKNIVKAKKVKNYKLK